MSKLPQRSDDIYLSKPLPQAVAAERSVLGSCLLDNRLFAGVSASLTREDFYLDPNRIVFDAMLACYRRGEALDPITLGEELRRTKLYDTVGGGSYVSALIDNGPRLENCDQYVALVAKASSRRRKISIANKLIVDLFDEEHDDTIVVDTAVAELCRENVVGTDGWVGLMDATINTLTEVEDRANLDRPLPLDTGLRDLDHATAGIEHGDYVIIGGQSSSGKTALATGIARSIASRARQLRVGDQIIERPQKVGILSLDMRFDAIIHRWIAADSGVDSRRIRRATDLTREERIAVNNAGMSLGPLPISCCEDPKLTLNKIDARATQLASEGDLACLIIDFIQMVGLDYRTASLRERIIDVSLGLKTLGKRLRVPVIALSQVTKEVDGRKGERPEVGDLLESSALRQHADLILLTWRPNADAFADTVGEFEPATIIVGKQRNGAPTDIGVHFLPWRTEFVNCD